MPVLHSIADQAAAPTLSSTRTVNHTIREVGIFLLSTVLSSAPNLQVGSEESEIFFKLINLMRLVMHTLRDTIMLLLRGARKKKKKKKTYNPPRANTPITPTLCLRGTLSPLNAEIGISKITRSVRMCIPALENHNAVELRQCPFLDRSQNLATGMQLRKPLITTQVP